MSLEGAKEIMDISYNSSTEKKCAKSKDYAIAKTVCLSLEHQSSE